VTSRSYLDAAARQAAVLQDAAHRPWPPPGDPWLEAQTRLDVLFAHWRVELDDAARLLPPELTLDTYAGEAWLGMVACRLAHVRLRGLPPMPLLTFGQLEVRTYVTLDDRPGVWLCSVDASNPLLLEAAKRVHRLPAYRARTSLGRDGPTRSWETRRDGLSFSARYRPAGDDFTAGPGSLEHFLTERYCIYTADGGRLYRAELHHPPWRLERAEASVPSSTIAPLPLEGEPHALCAAAQDVLVWPLEEL
jgi:uncharacterized protein YqjF (DUF2071 family)